MAITFIRATNIFKAEADTTVSSAGLSDNTTAILLYMAPRTTSTLTVSPQGFTLATTHLGDAGYIFVFHKAITVAANEPATYNINGTPAATDPCSFALLEMDDFNGVDVLGDNNEYRTNGTAVLTPSVTTTENNEICLITGNLSGNVSAIDPAPAGTTNFFSYNAAGGVRQVNYHVAWFEQVTAGATGDKDWNYIYAANGWSTATIITFKTLSAPDITGTLASTLEDTTSVASGVITTTGTLAETLENTTSAASGVITTTGTLAETLENAISAATGTIESTTTGTLQRHFISAGLWSSKAASSIMQLLGIPQPDFAINETMPERPVSWTSEVAGYYYINEATGTDTARTYGDPTAPRLTLPSPIPAGSYVEIEGDYTKEAQGVMFISGNGTSAAWVANVAGPVWITRSQASIGTLIESVFVYGTYVYLKDLIVVGSIQPRSNGSVANHIAFMGLDITGHVGIAGQLSGFGGQVAEPVHHIVFDNCSFHDNDPDWDTGVEDTEAHGIKPDQYCHDIWIQNSTFARLGGNAIQVADQNSVQANTKNIYFVGNEASQTRQAPVGVKKGENVFIMWNILHDAHEIQPANAPAGVAYQYAPKNLWIAFNEIYNTDRGIYGASDTSPAEDDVFIIGNNIHDVTYSDTITNPDYPGHFGQGIIINGSTNVRIIGNTIRRANGGIGAPTGSRAIYMENNIIAEMIGGHDHLFFESGTTTSISTLKNNLIDSTGNVIRWGTGSTAARESATSVDVSNLEGAVLFVAADDSRLQAGSQAKLAGLIPTALTEDVYQTYLSLYAENIKYDLDEVALAIVGNVTIGAYQ